MEIIVEKRPAYLRSYKKKLRREALVKDKLDKAIELMKKDQILADKIERKKWPRQVG